MGLWTQNVLVFKPRCFGEYLRCKSQNLGLSNVFKPFIPGREPLSLFPTVRVGFLMKLWPSLLQPLHCGPFLICQMDKSGSVFRAFSRGSCSILSHRFTVSPEGGKPRTLLCCHLQLELSAFNLGKKTMMWRTLPLPLFFRVHMCSPKQCISPTADASCDLNGA